VPQDRTVSEPHPSDMVGCPDCGLVQLLPPVASNSMAECARCRRELARPTRGGNDVTLALAIGAILLLLPAVLMPLMLLHSFGKQRIDWLPTGVAALWRDGFPTLASVVAAFSIAIPFLYLGLLIWVLAGIRLGAQASLGRVFRWTGTLRPWVMVEVYLIGCCVAYTRLQDVGTVSVGSGGWCLIGATVALMLAALNLDDRSVWKQLHTTAAPPRARRVISCEGCELVLDAAKEEGECPRCAARLHRRKPLAVQRTLACVIAGFLLYVPANLLPVLTIERFGREEPNTILGGVRELIASGLWPLAVLVFTASIIVPLMKLFGLSLMLLMVRLRSRRWLVGRTRLYRLIDTIGRWSNIDLFMISVLVALVQFGALTTVRPQAGAIAFAAVVVITMLASRSFDARLMWDAPGRTP